MPESVGVSRTKLGIADRVKEGSKTALELAEETGADHDALERLLTALATMEVFAKNEDGRISLTPFATTLLSGVPGSLRSACMLAAEPFVGDAVARLYSSVVTGKPSFDEVHAKNLFEYLACAPDMGRLFQDAMTASTDLETASRIVGAYDFSECWTIVDIGGGQGALLASILVTHPGVRGVLFDLPVVVDGAKKVFDSFGVASRCEIVQGDFFASPLPQGNVYVLKRILHDWDDARTLAILQRCRNVMKKDAKLLIMEIVTDERRRAWADLEMLYLIGGRERSASEFSQLLRRAGFHMERIVPAGNLDILEARKVDKLERSADAQVTAPSLPPPSA